MSRDAQQKEGAIESQLVELKKQISAAGALGVGGATTTYAYDAFGKRVLQTGTSTTYLYPFTWYSVASSSLCSFSNNTWMVRDQADWIVALARLAGEERRKKVAQR